MKPNFALTLSFKGIGLLHRAGSGWHVVDEIDLATDDLARDLAAARAKAQTLDASGLHSKLVLPDDQIKYLKIDRGEGKDPDAAVRAALEGATPYAVDELAFDWVERDGKLMIAAVARETLVEAEAFAVDHKFNPVDFVAMPATDAFPVEPFFGLTRHAASQGITPDQVAREAAPIRVLGRAAPAMAGTAAARIDAARIDAAEPPGKPTDIGAVEAFSDTDTTPPDQPPSAPTAEDTLAPFSTVRTSKADTGKADTGKADTETVKPAPRLTGVVREKTAPRITLGPTVDADSPDDVTPVTGVSEAALPDAAAPAIDIRAAAQDSPDIAEPPTAEAATTFTTRRKRTAKPPRDAERQRPSIFGTRTAPQKRAKPRFLGLILTAVLLLFLVGVAAWASIFMEDGLARFFRDDGDVPTVASLPADSAPDEAASTAASHDTDPEPVDLASVQPDLPVSVLEDPATQILSRVNPRDLSPDEARARYAATGIWQLAPDPPAGAEPSLMEDFYQTTLEPPPDFRDAVALPDAREAFRDGVFLTPPSPPAADTEFVLDARGFVRASPEGAMTPDAVMVYAGRPPVVAPDAIWQRADGANDQRAEPPDDQTAETQADLGVDTQTEAQTEPQSALAATRPRTRPDNAAEQIERNALSGRTRSELAALRPKLRPESAQEAAREAEAEAAAAAQASTVDLDALEGAVAEAVEAPDPFATATSQAVQISLKPKTPPRNFDRIVARTKRSLESRDTAQKPQTSRAQSAEPEESDEGETVQVAALRVTPSAPSATSVTKAATERRALKFERVNLIGVYGTPSDRRALVRMSNGRYHKVKVGDRLDGGRVSAISDAELRYQKGGRNIILKMPRG